MSYKSVSGLAHEEAIQAQYHSLLIGQTISHYRIVDRLGSGGMGVVYKAQDARLDRFVALKFLPEGLAKQPEALERFRREAKAASALNHPNICTIYDIGEHQGHPFIVMEALEGLLLSKCIANRALETSTLLAFAIEMINGLEAVHAVGIIHRDIKPSNLFVTPRGHVKILDFGLAKMSVPADLERPDAVLQDSTTSDLNVTAFGGTPGTVAYMSPEQVRNEELDPRTDLFSFGVVLYEMATGRTPFNRKTVGETFAAVLHDSAEPAGGFNPHIPRELDEIIAKALQKDRKVRYQHAAEIRTDLRRMRKVTPSAGRMVSTSQNRPKLQVLANVGSARWKIQLPISLALVLFLIAGTYWVRNQRSARASRLTSKDAVVLAEFANHTGDAVFDDTLKTALAVALKQSPFLNVISDNKVVATLKLMTRPPDTRLTPDVTRELCQRVDGKAYLAGSINSLGSQYVLGLKAVDCQSGDMLAQEQTVATSKEGVLDSLGRATANLRSELGESLVTVQKFDVPLSEATTPSLEALKAYSLGNKADGVSSSTGLPYHQRAVELDANFAMGYVAVGWDYDGMGETGRAREYFTKAFRLRDHASERERLEITASYYFNVTGEVDKAAQTAQETVESYPSSGPYLLLGSAYESEGQFEKAIAAYRQYLRFHLDDSAPYGDLLNCLLALQRFDEARRTAQEAQTRKLDGFVLHNALYALAFLGKTPQAMTQQQQWFAGKPEENVGISLAADTEAYSGHLSKARELSKRSVNSAIRGDSRETGALWHEIAAQREAAFGNPSDGRREAAQGLKLDSASQGVELEAALAFALAGDVKEAEPLAQDLNDRFPLDKQVQSVWLPTIRAQLALYRKNPSEALADLEATAPPIELGSISFAPNTSCLYPTFVRGQAYLAAGQGKESAAEFQRILDHSGMVWNCWTGALAHLGLARAYALEVSHGQGANAYSARLRALGAYKDFLSLWKDGDPDIPILKEAKAEYAKLQ